MARTDTVATKTPMGFGSNTRRFDVCGIHPGMKQPGSFIQVSYDSKALSDEGRRLGPGSYEIPNSARRTANSSSLKLYGPGWKEAYKSEMEAKMPHLLNREQFERRKKLKANLGPGTYDHTDPWDELRKKPQSKIGTCGTLVPRFERTYREPPRARNIPGPGTYGKGGIPSQVIDERQRARTSTVNMKRDGIKDRVPPQVGCDLGPGAYEYKSNMNTLLDKVVSKKGPYELFSGSRSKPISYGYFAQPIRANLGPGQYPVPAFTDQWNDKYWKDIGKFSKLAQYPNIPTDYMFITNLSQCPRNPGDPGPGAYDPKPVIKPVRPNKKPFNVSSERDDKRASVFFMGAAGTNPCGVGRYDIDRGDLATRKNGNTYRSSFTSRTKRYGHEDTAPRDKMMQERVRECNANAAVVPPITIVNSVI